MKSNKEIALEALRRAEIMHRRKAVRTRRIYGICSIAFCLAVIAALSFALPAMDSGGILAPEGAYSASLYASSAAGGYVIVGIIGFVLGAAVVILYNKSKKD